MSDRLDLTKIFMDGCLMQVHVSGWSGGNMLSPEDMGLQKDEVSKKVYYLGQKKFIPYEVIQKFHNKEQQARRIIEDDSFHFPLANANFTPRGLVIEKRKKLDQCIKEYMDLAEDLYLHFDEYRAQQRPEFLKEAEKAYVRNAPTRMEGSLDDATFLDEKQKFIDAFMARIDAECPTAEAVRKRYSMMYTCYTTSAPELNITDVDDVVISEEVKQKANQEYYAKVSSFADEVVRTMRKKTLEQCTKISRFITEGKIVKSSTVKAFKDFIDKFKTINFVGDAVIEEQFALLRKDLLDAYPENEYVNNVELRAELGRRIDMIAEIAEKISDTDIAGVTESYNRRIVIPD